MTRATTQQTFKKMSISTMKLTANKRQPIQDQVRVNNAPKPIKEGGLVTNKSQTTSLRSNNILKTPQKQTNSAQQSNTIPNQKINALSTNQFKINPTSTQLNSSQSINIPNRDTSHIESRIYKSQNCSSDTNHNSDKKITESSQKRI